MPIVDPYTEDQLTSLHALTVNEPYIRLGRTLLTPPLVYFEWLDEKVNLLGDDDSCAELSIDNYAQSYRLTIPGAGCLATAQSVRSDILRALKSPSVFERHVAPCSEFELFGVRRGYLQHEDLDYQLLCSGLIVMRLYLTLTELATSGTQFAVALAPATGSVHLKWSDDPTSTSYDIYQGPGTSLTGLSLIDSVSAPLLTYDVTGLTPEDYYVFQVKNSDGDAIPISASLNCY